MTRYGGGRAFVRCEGATSAATVVTELATALGLPLTGGDPLPACLGRLAERPAAVCLDNAETPWEADTLATEGLFAQLAGIAGVGLVVSLRGAEQPAGPSWARPVRLEPLDAAEVRTLFLSVTGERFDEPGLRELLARWAASRWRSSSWPMPPRVSRASPALPCGGVPSE